MEGQATQWPKEKVQRTNKGNNKITKITKARSTKHTNKTKDRITRTPLRTGGELS